MISPKIFYRKLDSLLVKIGKDKSSKDYLIRMVDELEHTFGTDLHIGEGRIYEENEDEYLLVHKPSGSANKDILNKISINSEAVKTVLKNKTYIFDNPVFSIDSDISSQDEYAIPAAITINNQENRWIFVFELKSGWEREEIEFCLNAVRTMLNYRLFSESVKDELEQAVQIQQSLLPTSVPDFPGFEVYGKSQPAELVGGDLYDYYSFDPDGFGVCIGDASGHGIPAALMVRDVVTGLRMGLEKHMKMVHTLKKLNNVIYQSVYSTRFISLFYAEIENEGNIFYANAGHPAPFIVNADDVTELKSTGLIFGALPEIDLQRGYASIKKDEVLCLYTDGILERQNDEAEQFGIERLISLVKDNRNKSSRELSQLIFSVAHEFGLGKKWKDDATVVIIKKL